MSPDYTTSTVDGAAAHARQFAAPAYDDRPTPAEAWWPVGCEGCDGTGGNVESACDLCGGSGNR